MAVATGLLWVPAAAMLAASARATDSTFTPASNNVSAELKTQQSACVPPPANLVSWWPGDGNANDIAGGRDGTPQNGAGFAPGKVNQAFNFTPPQFVSVPDDPQWTFGNDPFTIDLWVNFRSIGIVSPFISHDDGGGQRNKWVFHWDAVAHRAPFGVALRFHVNYFPAGPILDTVVFPSTPNLGQWYHVAVTRSGSAYSLYIDGQHVITENDPNPIPDASVPLTIGNAESFFFDGLIDEVEIFDRALSASEIQAIFNAGSAGKCKVSPPATLTLAPKTDTNTVGTTHTVTATVMDAGGNPVPSVTVQFSVTGANSASGSQATDANGQASFTYTGTTAGMDAISAFADTDSNGTQEPGEPGDTATKTWTPGAPATLTLAPAADANTVGATHCVTATVRDAFGNPVPGVTVRFSVPTAVATHASPSSGSDVTDANGEATFCYSASLPGQDTIHAFADTDEDGTQDAAEPFGDATKTWLLPPSTALCKVTITEGGWIVANNGDRASFGGNARVSADGSRVRGQQEYQDHGPAQPLNVHSITLTAVTCSEDLQSATIFGTATIDGSGTFVFRIDVTDLGEPGTNDSYGIILSNGYVSGQHQLQGGNVQIHKS